MIFRESSHKGEKVFPNSRKAPPQTTKNLTSLQTRQEQSNNNNPTHTLYTTCPRPVSSVFFLLFSCYFVCFCLVVLVFFRLFFSFLFSCSCTCSFYLFSRLFVLSVFSLVRAPFFFCSFVCSFSCSFLFVPPFFSHLFPILVFWLFFLLALYRSCVTIPAPFYLHLELKGLLSLLLS